MVAILDRKAQVFNGKKTLIRKALHRASIGRLAGEVFFMQPRSRLKKTDKICFPGAALHLTLRG